MNPTVKTMSTAEIIEAERTSNRDIDPSAIPMKALDMLIDTLADDDDISVRDTLRKTLLRFRYHTGIINTAALICLESKLSEWD